MWIVLLIASLFVAKRVSSGAPAEVGELAPEGYAPEEPLHMGAAYDAGGGGGYGGGAPARPRNDVRYGVAPTRFGPLTQGPRPSGSAPSRFANHGAAPVRPAPGRFADHRAEEAYENSYERKLRARYGNLPLDQLKARAAAGAPSVDPRWTPRLGPPGRGR